MPKTIAVLSSIMLFLLVGCTNQTSSEEDNTFEEEIRTLKTENETLKEQINELQQLEKENESLQQELKDKEESYLRFISASHTSRSFIEAMIRGNVEKLNTLTTSELEAFEGYFEQKINDQVIEVPYDRFYSHPYINREVIISVYGYGIDDDKLWIQYASSYDEKQSYINLELKKVGEQWKINSITYDI
jgi:hypothetical protein